MIFKRKLFFTTIFVLLSTNSYSGGVMESMGDFWESVGGSSSNATEAQGYQLQGAGYYTGGNFAARSKVVNVRPLTIVPPGIRAGCGGIDIYTGAFSHINTDQFVAMLKAIPSNALGFTFQLALETMSPAIKGTLDKLQSISDQINSVNINSCDAGRALVGLGSLAAGSAISQQYCTTTANAQGWATDYARAAADCGNGGKSASNIKAANNVHGDKRLVDINVAWEVLKKSNLATSQNKEFAQFIQSLTGTFIIKSPENENDGSITKYIPSSTIEHNTIKNLIDGGKVSILKCNDQDKCLNPTKQEITIDYERAFKGRITKLLNEIITRLSTGEDLSEEHKSLVTKTSLPILKYLIVKQAYFKSKSASSSINSEYLATIISLDLIHNYLNDVLLEVSEQAKQVKSYSQDDINKFQNSVEQIRLEVNRYSVNEKEGFDRTMKIIQTLQKLEESLAARTSSDMKSTITFGSKI